MFVELPLARNGAQAATQDTEPNIYCKVRIEADTSLL